MRYSRNYYQYEEPQQEQKISPAVWVLIGLLAVILVGGIALLVLNALPSEEPPESPPELSRPAEESSLPALTATPVPESTPSPTPAPTPTPQPAGPDEELYQFLYAQVDALQQTVSFTEEELTKEQIVDVMNRIQRQPEFFWLDGATYYRSGTEYEIEFHWKYDDPESCRREVEQVAAEALDSIPYGAGDYEKALALHDWLCDHIVYQYNQDGSDQDLYGALVKGKCVCAGYCAAYEYLLGQVGVEAETVRGDADNGSWVESHAWTKVILDGDVYYTDVTWDDQADHPDGHTYAWFATTSAFMEKTHFANPEQGAEMTPSTAVACNYYYRNGWVLEQYDTEDLIQIFSDQESDCLTVLAADEETYQQLVVLFHDTSDTLAVLEESGHPANQYTYYMTDGAWSLDIFPA